MKSGNLNFLEPSGPLQACNGTALPLPFTIIITCLQSMISDRDSHSYYSSRMPTSLATPPIRQTCCKLLLNFVYSIHCLLKHCLQLVNYKVLAVVEETVEPFETVACSPMTVNYPQGITVNGVHNSIIL